MHIGCEMLVLSGFLCMLIPHAYERPVLYVCWPIAHRKWTSKAAQKPKLTIRQIEPDKVGKVQSGIGNLFDRRQQGLGAIAAPIVCSNIPAVSAITR